MDTSPLNLENKLLVATPAMRDPRFRHAVIFICTHSDEGAMGIVVNRAKKGGPGGGELHLSELLDSIGVEGRVRVADTPVLAGGPVDMERGFVLHSLDYQTPDATMPISDTLALTSTKDVLDARVSDRAPSRAILAVGYSGWGEGQIEEELGENAWIVCEPEPHILDALVFDGDLDAKWKDALAGIGVDAAGLSGASGHA